MNRFNARALMACPALCIAALVVASAARERQVPPVSWAHMLRDADAGSITAVRLERHMAWWRTYLWDLPAPLRCLGCGKAHFVASYRPSRPGGRAKDREVAEPDDPSGEVTAGVNRLIRDRVTVEIGHPVT